MRRWAGARPAGWTAIRSLAAALSALLVAGGTGAQVRVRQGATEYDLAPLSGGQSVQGFYAYSTVHNASANTGLETANTSLLFFYQQTAGSPPPLSLVVIHDRYDDGTGGDAQMDFAGLPAGAFHAVEDDAGGGGGGGDSYTPVAGGATSSDWSWGPCCTDGQALGGLGDSPFCIAVTPRFGFGINAWQVLSGPGPSPARLPLPSLAGRTWLCRDCQQLACPATVGGECGGNGLAWVPLGASGSSLCGGASIANDRTAGGADASDFYPLGTTDVTFTLSDGPGFRSTCSSQVLVEDSQAPVILSCPAPLTLPCDEGPIPLGDPRVQAWLAGFAASDVCGAVALANDAPAVFPPTCQAAPTVVTFTARDPSGNLATCQSSVTIADLAPPAVTACPAPEAHECEQRGGIDRTSPTLAGFFAGFAASDDCGPPGLGDDAPGLLPAGCAPGTTTGVTFTATDACGKTATCASSLTVRDTTPPAVGCPAPAVFECSARGGAPAGDPAVDAWRRSATASDLCGDATLADDLPALLPFGCSPGRATPVRFTASDGCALTSDCPSQATVVDSAAPAITACPGPLGLECSAPGGVPRSDSTIQSWLSGFAASDLCDDTTLGNDAPALFPAGCAPGQPTTVAFTAADGCQNQAGCNAAVTVADTTPPDILACPAAATVECAATGGTPRGDPQVQAWLAGFAARDLCGSASLSNNAPAFFPAACAPGQATVVGFTAADGCQNQAGCQGALAVADSTPPRIDACPAPLVLECDGAGGIAGSDPRIQAWLAGFQASDVCGAVGRSDDAPAFFPSGCGVGAATVVTFTATDACGLRSTCRSSVTVRDTTPPAIVRVPAPLTLECNSPGGEPAGDPRLQAWLGEFAAADLCDGAVTGNDAPALFPSGCGAGATTTVTFRATDNCGNQATAQSSVTVIDTTPPVVTGCALPLEPPLPPLPPAPPASACVGSSRAVVRVDCGAGIDACDPGPALEPSFVLSRRDVVGGSCVGREDRVPVACGEVVELRRLAAPCPARPPRSPQPPVVVRSDGVKVLFGERIRLEVDGRDSCGNRAAPCTVDATGPGGPVPCPPRPPACPRSCD